LWLRVGLAVAEDEVEVLELVKLREVETEELRLDVLEVIVELRLEVEALDDTEELEEVVVWLLLTEMVLTETELEELVDGGTDDVVDVLGTEDDVLETLELLVEILALVERLELLEVEVEAVVLLLDTVDENEDELELDVDTAPS
jgi:hypothetical protein